MKKLSECSRRWLMIAMIGVLSWTSVSTMGCAGKTKSSTVITESTNSGLGSTSSVTTQNEVVTDSHPRGVIGGLFYTIGQVLIFPFRVIGNLFS